MRRALNEGSRSNSWLDVGLGALTQNLARIERRVERDLLLVGKSNAYGHGLERIADAAVRAGVRMLGVAQIGEGLLLRHAGISAPVLVLGAAREEDLRSALITGLTLTVWQEPLLHRLARLAEELGLLARLHLKVDTGMGRLGCSAEEAPRLLSLASRSPWLRVDGISTHLAASDAESLEPSRCQLERFEDLLRRLQAEGLRPPLAHAANSAGAWRLPEARFDLVRVGIHAYGVPFGASGTCASDLSPVLTWKSRLASIRDLPAGHGVGYGPEYRCLRRERIGVVPVGYADGFRRSLRGPEGLLKQEVLVGGKRVPIRGQVCMDLFSVGLDLVPDAREGDEVVLLGAQGQEGISAHELAERWGTVEHDALCTLMPRSPRHYFGALGHRSSLRPAHAVRDRSRTRL